MSNPASQVMSITETVSVSEVKFQGQQRCPVWPWRVWCVLSGVEGYRGLEEVGVPGGSVTPSGCVVFVCMTCLDHVILLSVCVVPAQRGQKWICVMKHLLMDSIKCSILK